MYITKGCAQTKENTKKSTRAHLTGKNNNKNKKHLTGNCHTKQ